MITVHHLPASRSCRVLWLLEELRLPYQVDGKSFGDGSLRSPEYLAKNPLGRAPTIEIDGDILYESGAILQLLLERFGDGRLEPSADSPLRASFLQWFHWGEATLMPPIVAINSNRFVLKERDRSEAALNVARRQLSKALRVLDDELRGKHFLVGDEFTAADIMVGYAVSNAKMGDELPGGIPFVRSWIEGLAARPAYLRAFEGGFGSVSR